jgi:hypothetical protein
VLKADLEAACPGGVTQNVKAALGAVKRLNLEPGLGQRQRVTTDAAAKVERSSGAARPQLGQQGDDRRMRVDPIGAPLLGGPALLPGVDRRPGLSLHDPPPYSGSFAPPTFA